MHPKRTSLAFVAFALSFHAGSAGAQTFAELAAGAREVDHELGSLAAPLLTSCEALVGRSRELCDANRGRAAAELGGEPLLVSMPAGDRVEVGPYEPRQGGFRVTVPAFEVSGRDGVVAVRRADARARRADPRARRASPLAEAFVRVPAEEAPAWAARNSTERLRLRLVFRFGDARVDRSRTGPAAPRVVEAGVIAAQLFNASTGNVLLDSTSATGALPRAPEPLDRRRALFSAQLEREVLFRAPNGRSALFHVRIERAEGAVGITPIVLLTHGAETVELVRFVAVPSESTVDVVPHGGAGALIVITEKRSRRGMSGRGQVLFLRWDPTTERLAVIAEWRGSNDERPPAWVHDPEAPLPPPT